MIFPFDFLSMSQEVIYNRIPNHRAGRGTAVFFRPDKLEKRRTGPG